MFGLPQSLSDYNGLSSVSQSAVRLFLLQSFTAVFRIIIFLLLDNCAFRLVSRDPSVGDFLLGLIPISSVLLMQVLTNIFISSSFSQVSSVEQLTLLCFSGFLYTTWTTPRDLSLFGSLLFDLYLWTAFSGLPFTCEWLCYLCSGVVTHVSLAFFMLLESAVQVPRVKKTLFIGQGVSVITCCGHCMRLWDGINLLEAFIFGRVRKQFPILF